MHLIRGKAKFLVIAGVLLVLVSIITYLSIINPNQRLRKITISEAQVLDNKIGQNVVPEDLKFIHEETYREVTIVWTDKQVIPAERLKWLKAAIDKLPPFFIKDHPVTKIVSATCTELKLTGDYLKTCGMADAFADGTKIIIGAWSLIDLPSFMPPATQEGMTYRLFHEWMHVVQYYEALQTFKPNYLFKNGAHFPNVLTPFMREFGKSVGWKFNSDQSTGQWTASLNPDNESQKTTEYGKASPSEDMAETAAFFMTCQSDKISAARISWMEKITKTKAADYCK